MAVPAVSGAEPVDLELVLAVDVSGSIDDDEARLQRDGYITAITDEGVLSVIQSGQLGRIAIAYIEWGSAVQQSLLVNWTLVQDRESANAFAGALAAAPRIIAADRTSISGAIQFALPMFEDNGFESERLVIDISGDGPNNSGNRVDLARDLAIARGVTINGLPVVNDRPNRFGLPGLPDLDRYYENCVIGGPGSFLVVARDFGDFAGAILRKFIREIAAHPTGRAHDTTHTARLSPMLHVPLDGLGDRQPALHTVADSPDCDIGERRFRRFFGDK